MTTPLQRYNEALATGNFSEDSVQRQAMSYLDSLYHKILDDESGNKGFFSFFKKSEKIQGLYMWGGVGRGKTWMMDMFYDSLPIDNKMRMHFHHFMKYVQSELNQLQGQADPLHKVADIIRQKARVICFDEFFVSNVADAMILGDLFTLLFDKGVVLVATSNIAPDGLYKNGIHRDRFLPAIEEVKKHTTVMNIDAGVDYRLRLLKQAKLYVSPLSDESKNWLSERFDAMSANQTVLVEPIDVNGRSINITKRTETTLLANFRDLCMQPRSAADFIEIANNFSTVMVDNVPALNDTISDPVLRFIYLVDEFYDRRVKLLVRAEQPILELYSGQKLAFEIERTRSRLLEMQSEDYLSQAHRLDDNPTDSQKDTQAMV